MVSNFERILQYSLYHECQKAQSPVMFHVLLQILKWCSLRTGVASVHVGSLRE